MYHSYSDSSVRPQYHHLNHSYHRYRIRVYHENVRYRPEIRSILLQHILRNDTVWMQKLVYLLRQRLFRFLWQRLFLKDQNDLLYRNGVKEITHEFVLH